MLNKHSLSLPLIKRATRVAVIASSLLSLAACGSLESQNLSPLSAKPRPAYVITVSLGAGDTPQSLSSLHGGTIVAWRPQDGFAVLGVNTATGKVKRETNRAVVDVPEVGLATAKSAQGFGSRAWGGGSRSWSGGFSALGGGTEVPSTFTENTGLWSLIKLPAGQLLAPNLGAGVKVAVIDSGIDLNHPAFAGKLAPSSDWYDFVDGDTVPQEVFNSAPGASNDGYGHGTAVAGVIAQIAPKATILPIRALGPDGSGDVAWVSAAIDHAIKKGARVINLSLGTDVSSAAIQSMVDSATKAGIIVVSSSGNSGTSSVTFPAANSMLNGKTGNRAVGVGSISATSLKSTFSTYGSRLKLLAPGEFIYTLYPENQIAYWHGTSFAAPIVAGSAALALGQPISSSARNTAATGVADTATNLDLLDPLYRGQLGYGRLDVEAYLQKMLSM